MKEMHIRLQSFQDIRDLAVLSSAQPYGVRISDTRFTVNAKSPMCLLSLNLHSTLRLQLDCGEDDFERFRQQAARFEVT